MFYIYGIVDPITSEIRYVGYTSKKPTRRLIGHLTEEGKGDKAQWINDLLDDGLLPSVVTLQKAETEHEARLIERWWIYQGQISRWPLLNELHAVKPAAPKISRVFNEAEPRYIPENNKTEGPGRRPKWQEFAADWREQHPNSGPSALARAMWEADGRIKQPGDYKSEAFRTLSRLRQSSGGPK